MTPAHRSTVWVAVAFLSTLGAYHHQWVLETVWGLWSGSELHWAGRAWPLPSTARVNFRSTDLVAYVEDEVDPLFLFSARIEEARKLSPLAVLTDECTRVTCTTTPRLNTVSRSIASSAAQATVAYKDGDVTMSKIITALPQQHVWLEIVGKESTIKKYQPTLNAIIEKWSTRE